MNVALHLRIAGALLLALAGLNTLFPRRFGWRQELAQVSLLTRQVFYVHTFFIILTLAFMGLLAAVFPRALLEPSLLGLLLAAGLCLFWTARLIVQFFVYDTRLWRGHRFNTAMHVVFSALWTYLVLVFAL